MAAGLRLDAFTRWTGLVISICIADSVAFAYDNSLMGSLSVMPAYKNYFQLSTALVSSNNAMAFVGGIVVALIAGPTIDYKGRKFGILLACVMQIVGAVLQGAAKHIAMFILGKELCIEYDLQLIYLIRSIFYWRRYWSCSSCLH